MNRLNPLAVATMSLLVLGAICLPGDACGFPRFGVCIAGILCSMVRSSSRTEHPALPKGGVAADFGNPQREDIRGMGWVFGIV